MERKIIERGRILLAHGDGGRLTHELIQNLFKRQFDNPILNQLDDAAEFFAGSCRLAFSTDSYVVNPLFFPGGDIGKLAVFGTVNDLAMKGAKPLYLSASFIMEEGLELRILESVVSSMVEAAAQAEVQIISGDTKVVERGKADGMFITTTGVGQIEEGVNISGRNAQVGDCVILSGTVGDHGIAILNARENLGLKGSLKSDCAPLSKLVKEMLQRSKNIHVLRDPTRGGLATALNEIASQSGVGIVVEEDKIPIKDEVKAACDLLGFEALYLGNEGKLVAFVSPDDTEEVLEVMRNNPVGKEAMVIGQVVSEVKGVFLKTSIGGMRRLIMLEGKQLPRIC